MLEFAIAVFLLIVTPGPGVLSTAGVGSAFGSRAGLAYVGGLWAGNNLVAALVVSGLAAAALSVPWLRTVLLWGSVLYLVYLAAKIAFAGSRLAFIHPERAPGFLRCSSWCACAAFSSASSAPSSSSSRSGSE